jgi:SAC3/GANP family
VALSLFDRFLHKAQLTFCRVVLTTDERIARWHAMCEHQLSHITEFVTHQSQQNIQELGQTMKTLNQYYDDALGRSRVEVPDEAGNETRTVTRGFSHGCTYDIVQGQDPVDFNQSPLANNTASIERRLIGNSENHGTAEAEMRGLYMLLTIDNDGGMEGKCTAKAILLFFVM